MVYFKEGDNITAVVSASMYTEGGATCVVLGPTMQKARAFKSDVAEIMANKTEHKNDIRHRSGGVLMCRTYHPLSEGFRGMSADAVFFLDSANTDDHRRLSTRECVKQKGVFMEVRP